MEVFEYSNLYLDVLRRRKLNKLWDVNEELFEVDVYKENNVLETDVDDILNTGGIHCHICNLEVPKMYIKEHNQTSTHQNLLKITDEALERTRNYMKNTETSNLTIKVENTYFCEECSRIVLNSEKELHDKSNFHKKCVNFNNLLSCFVDSYLNINEKKYNLNCNLDNDCVKNNDKEEYVIMLSEMQQKDLFKNLEPQAFQKNLKTDYNELENTDMKIELDKKQSQELTQKQVPNHELLKTPKMSRSEKLKIYFDTIKSKNINKNFNIEYISKTRVKITALNKDVITVPLQHFHSYNNKFCRVCLSEVLGDNHKDLEDHISRIMTPIADKNGIREVDDIWSHCIICNELTKMVVSHCQSVNHLSNLKKFYIVQFSRSQMVQTHNLQNDTENSQIQSATVKKQSEEQKSDIKLDITPHFEEFFKRIDSKIDSLFPIFKKALENESLKDESDDFLIVGRNNKPTTSGHYVNSNVDTAKETDTFNIQTNKLELQKVKSDTQNKFEINQNTSLNNNNTNLEAKLSHYCFVCKINVTDFNTHKLLESHKVMSKENKKRAQEIKKILITNNFLLNKDQNTVTKCGLCDVIVSYDKDVIETHINTDGHRKKYLKFMEDNKIILIDRQECHCEPCDRRQSRSNVFSHCSTPQHVNKLNKYIIKNTVENGAQKRKKSVEINASKTIDISKLMYNFQINGENLLCKTCYVCIPKIDVFIKQHLDSSEHCIKYNGIMTNNKVQIDTDSFYCEICSVKIPLGGEFDHVYSNSHRVLVLKSKSKHTESIVSTSEAKVESVLNIQPIKALPEKAKEIMIPQYVKHHFKKCNKTEAYCRICNISLPYSEIKTHIEKFPHSLSFNVLMRKNGIKVKDNIYACLFCETTISRFNEVDHIYGRQHVKKFEEKKIYELSSDLDLLTYNYISTLPGVNRQVLL